MKEKIKFLNDFAQEMNDNNIQAFSSSVAFFFFLAVIPMLMFFCSLIPYLPFTEEEFVSVVLSITPDSVDATVESVINGIYDSTIGIIPVTALVSLWTAGMGIMGLIRGLNGILHIHEKRNYFVLRGIAVIYTILLLAVIVASIILGIFGSVIYGFIGRHYPLLAEALSWLRFSKNIIVFAIVTVVLDLAYAFLPAQRQRLIISLPGAVIAALGWFAVTWFYSVYIDVFGGFSAYGSLMIIIFMLFWLYACFTMVMFGAYINNKFKTVTNAGVNSIKRYRRRKKEEKISKKEV